MQAGHECHVMLINELPQSQPESCAVTHSNDLHCPDTTICKSPF